MFPPAPFVSAEASSIHIGGSNIVHKHSFPPTMRVTSSFSRISDSPDPSFPGFPNIDLFLVTYPAVSKRRTENHLFRPVGLGPWLSFPLRLLAHKCPNFPKKPVASGRIDTICGAIFSLTHNIFSCIIRKPSRPLEGRKGGGIQRPHDSGTCPYSRLKAFCD